MKHLHFVIALVSLISCQRNDTENSLFNDKMAQAQAQDIENIKIKDRELGGNFVLFQENLSKPNKQATSQITQRWERDTIGSDLKMTEEQTIDLVEPIGASCTQKWYRSGKKEKIEVDIIICSLESEMDKTVETFTKKMYSLQFKQTEIPLAGDKSWLADGTYSEINSYTMMFLKANVFVRIYVNLTDENINELKVTAYNVASNIETKILSEMQ